MNNYRFGLKYFLIVFALCTTTTSCKKFFDVPVDKSQVISDQVFASDQNAISASNGMYLSMVSSAFAGGGSNGISALTGLSSDEFHNVLNSASFMRYENNELTSTDAYIATLWTDAYKVIYQANDIIEELDNSKNVTSTVKNRIKGEALYVRAFCFFNLVNLFGDVPLILTPDYKSNSNSSKVPVADIYNQIVSDLIKARDLLPEEYVKAQRTKPNKSVASALLARVYLYTEKWAEAESEATKVIDNTVFSMQTDLNQVFKIESGETIWQLASEQGFNTREGSSLILTFGIGSASKQLTSNLLTAFESGDQRLNKWVGVYTNPQNGLELSFPFKYKEPYNGNTSEYFVVFRLAEQYLIRAEARAQLDNYTAAIADLNVIRTRAKLPAIDENSITSKNATLNIVYHERAVELFSEWGHRWYDLKRTNRADEVISSLKSTWSIDDALYPLPEQEFLRNPALGSQNNGY